MDARRKRLGSCDQKYVERVGAAISIRAYAFGSYNTVFQFWSVNDG
jgi:hypothetical protein